MHLSLKDLEHLNIACNLLLKEVSEEIGQLSKLKTFNACACANLTQLPRSIENLQKLKIIHLEFTRIASNPDSLAVLKGLNLSKIYLKCFFGHSDEDKQNIKNALGCSDENIIIFSESPYFKPSQLCIFLIQAKDKILASALWIKDFMLAYFKS